MSCKDWEERIALRAGGDLPEREAAEVDRHLAECDDCRETAAAYGWGLELLQQAHREPIAPAHYAAVRARVLAKLEREPQSVWRRPWVWAAAAVVIAAVLFSWPARVPERRIAVIPPREPAAEQRWVGPSQPSVAVKPTRHADATRQPTRAGRQQRRAAPPLQATQTESKTPILEPAVIKLLTDDPNVIIYWIADRKGE